MINRTFAAALVLCLLTASYANAGGHGRNNSRHHDNRDFRNAGLNFSDNRLFKGIGKDERNDLFNDNNLGAGKQIGGGKGNNHVIWASSGPDCLVAPVQTSGSTETGKAHRSDHAKH